MNWSVSLIATRGMSDGPTNRRLFGRAQADGARDHQRSLNLRLMGTVEQLIVEALQSCRALALIKHIPFVLFVFSGYVLVLLESAKNCVLVPSSVKLHLLLLLSRLWSVQLKTVAYVPGSTLASLLVRGQRRHFMLASRG